MKKRTVAIIVLVIVSFGLAAIADDRLPSDLQDYSPPFGPSPYDDPASVLGRPTTWILGVPGPGFPGGDFASSMVFGAWNTDLSGNKLVTTINSSGYITVRFDTPIEHDPANWFNKDFIVFGNSAFAAIGVVYANSNMETLKINNGAAGTWEPSVVSVSQDNVTWYDYTSGPYADDFAPTQAFTWDRDAHNWDLELDWTKPLDPALTKSSFAGKWVADAIDMYNGSAGGTAFDISGFPLALNGNGRKWIQFVKITGSGGEVDAISRVSRVPTPTAIAAAKLLPDRASVRLAEGIVTASKAELGDCLYIEDPNRACGIKVTGRSIGLGRRVIVGGVMTTVNGERKIKAMSVEDLGTGTVAPLAMTGKAFGQGLGVTGLLVRTSGKAGSIDQVKRTFTVDDGSGVKVKCIWPTGTWFELPGNGVPVVVTGIASCELDAQQHVIPTLRMWTQARTQ